MSVALLNDTGKYPLLEILLDVSDNSTSPPKTPNWVDVTDKVREASIKPTYRQNALDRFEAGTLSLVIDNNGREFDPTYVSSPYYPFVRPMTRFKVRATWNSVVYELITAFMDGAPQEWPSFGTDALVKVSCTDVFKVLNLADLDQSGSVATKGKYTPGTGFGNIAAGDTSFWIESWPSEWQDPATVSARNFMVVIDSEWMLVLGTGADLNTATGFASRSPATRDDAPVQITVTRAQNGTTAAAHTAGAGVQRAGLVAKNTGDRLIDVLKELRLEDLIGTITYGGPVVSTIDTGISTCVKVSPGSELKGVMALAHILDVVDTENGVLYVRGDGDSGEFVFQDRHHRVLNGLTPVCVFGEDQAGGELGYEEISAPYDEERLWNVAKVTCSDVNSTVKTWQNDASVERNGPRTLERSSLTDDVNDGLNAAQYIAYKYGDPELRFDQIQVQPASDPDNMWPVILGLRISDRVTVKRRPGVGPAISLDNYLEATPQHDITPDGWKVTLSLSDANKDTFWLLGDSTYSVLGSTTKPGY